MKTLRISAFVAGLLALLAADTTLTATARAEGGTPQAEVSVLGGIQALNKNDTALPDQFINVPATAALTYHLNQIWAVEGEFTWMIPVKTSVDLGGSLGMAVLGSVGVAIYRAGMANAVPAEVPPAAAEVARSTLGGAVAVARDLPPQAGAVLLDVARGAFAESYVAFALVSAALMLVAAATLARIEAGERPARSPAPAR